MYARLWRQCVYAMYANLDNLQTGLVCVFLSFFVVVVSMCFNVCAFVLYIVFVSRFSTGTKNGN